MPDLVYRFDPNGPDPRIRPRDAESARALLLEGNAAFVDLERKTQIVHMPPQTVGIGMHGQAPAQLPFASILACSDARVPVELLFHCGSNELFVVRVAGNVPGDECIGSLEFASSHLSESLAYVVVLGHTGCGAVTGAVDTYLTPRTYPKSAMLRAIVDRILPAVRTADLALQQVHGAGSPSSPEGREALLDASVTLNAALAAMTVRDDLGGPVEYGVFDLATRQVTIKTPPTDAEAFVALADEVARSERIVRILGT